MNISTKNSFKKHISFLLCFIMIFVQLLTYNPIQVFAADLNATISPVASKASDLPKRITVTKTGAFTAGGVTPYLLDSNNQVVAATITNVESTANSVSFTVGTGLTNGTYKVRLIDTVNGTLDVTPATFSIGNPTVAISSTTLPTGYGEQSVTVTGTNTNFAFGVTKVEIYNGATKVQQSTVTAVASTSQLTFTLAAGLTAGSYIVRVTTDSETADASLTIATPSISTNKSQLTLGYSATDIIVTGTNTNFNAQTTVAILDNTGTATGKAGTPTGVTATSLTFKANTGLAAGSYTVKVANGETVLGTAQLTVVTPSAVLKNGTAAFTGASQGYTNTYSLTLEGTNTNFTTDTTLTLYKAAVNESNVIINKITNKSVSSSTALTFTLGTGLDNDTYILRAKTGGETVDVSFAINPISVSGITFNPNTAVNTLTSPKELGKGYKELQITATGVNTLFQANSTIKVLDSNSADTSKVKAGSITANSATSISFTLLTGLDTGTYTIEIDMDGSGSTSNDIVTTTFKIVQPSNLSITPGNILKSTSTTPVQFTVTGTNTHFKSGSSITYTVSLINATGDAIETETIAASDNNTLTFNIKPSVIEESDDEGYYDLTVTTTSSVIVESVVIPNAIRMQSTGISPSAASVITYTTELGSKEITINGNNTNFTSSTKVYLDKNKDGNYKDAEIIDTDEEVTSVNIDSATKLRFTIPADLAAGEYTLWVNDGVDHDTKLTVVQRTIQAPAPSSVYFHQLGNSTINITGQNTVFDSNTKVFIDKNGDGDYMNGPSVDTDEEISSKTITSTTSLSFTIPTGLASGNVKVWVVEGSYVHQSTITVVTPTIAVSPESETFEYTGFTMTVNGTDVTFDTSTNKPSVSIVGSTTTNVTLANGDITANSFTFTFPTDLASGSYKVRLTWSGGDYAGMILEDTFTVNQKYSLLSFKKDDTNTTNVTLTQGAANFNLQAWGTVAVGGAEINVTSNASWSVVSGSAVSVNNTDNKGFITVIGTGTATVRAAYDGRTKDIVITINATTGGIGSTPTTPTNTTTDPTTTPEPTPTLEPTPIPVEEKPRSTGSVINLEVKVNEETGTAKAEFDGTSMSEVIAEAKESNTDITLKLPETNTTSNAIELNTAAVEALVENKVNINIVVSEISVKIPSEVVAEHKGASIQLEVKQINEEEKAQIISKAAESSTSLKSTGTAIEINMTAISSSGSKQVTSFKEKITLELNAGAVDTTKVNTKKLGVYYLDEITNTWKYVGGRYDSSTGNIIVKTDHFTIFAVFENNRSFSDVTTGYWAKEYIEVLAARHISNGVDDTNYDPQGTLTRSQFATFIVRALDLPLEEYTGAFKDVNEDDWFAPYVEAIAKAGIVNGTSADTFSPNMYITREQMAKMVVSAYLFSTGKSLNELLAGELTDFDDIDEAAEWAVDYIKAAKKLDLINGITEKLYQPKINAQRAQAAKIIYKLLEVLGEL